MIKNSELDWISWTISQEPLPNEFWNAWAQGAEILAFVGTNERDARISLALASVARNFRNRWEDIGRGAYLRKGGSKEHGTLHGHGGLTFRGLKENRRCWLASPA